MPDGEMGISIITSHPFTPRREWWTRCRDCRLYEASHQDTVVEGVGDSGVWYGNDGKWMA